MRNSRIAEFFFERNAKEDNGSNRNCNKMRFIGFV